MTSNFIYLFNRNNTFSFCGDAALSLSNAPRATRCFSNHMVPISLLFSISHSLTQSVSAFSRLSFSFMFCFRAILWHLAKLHLIKLARNQDELIGIHGIRARTLYVWKDNLCTYSFCSVTCMSDFSALPFYACNFTSLELKCLNWNCWKLYEATATSEQV